MKGYKYRSGIGILDKDGKSIFERDVNTIVNNQIYLPTKDELNDPTEGFYDDASFIKLLETLKGYSSEVKKQYYKLLDKFKNIGVYSLSKNNDNELLWAYYASGYTGFAIEYDIDILKESLNHNAYFQFVFDFDVDYVERIPQVDISLLHDKNPNLMLKTFLGSKSLSWEHEDEYRLIFDGNGLFDIDYRAITGIYFGYRMHEDEEDFIMDKLKGRRLNYYKMELIEHSYKFKPKRIEDKYMDTPQYIANSLDYDIDKLLMPIELLGEEAYSYKGKLIQALEIVRHEPLIKEIYIATIKMNNGKPLFIIWAYTKSGIPTSKEFNFKLNEKGEVYRTK